MSAETPAQTSTGVLGLLQDRMREGLARVRGGIFQALQLTIAAVGAFVFAERVLGHHGPIFAATAATVALGFSKGGIRYRRVLEVAIGCTLGILLAESLTHLIGRGIWQAAVVMLVSALLAQFLDSGVLFTTQMALQSLLVIMLPAPVDGTLTRSIDAMVGGLFALVLVYLVPTDPRRQPREQLRKLTTELSDVMREAADAVRQDDSQKAWHCLVRARRTQPIVDAVTTSLKSSHEIAVAAPLHRRHRSEVEAISNAIRYLDLVARNTRVLARRVASIINHITLSAEAVDSISDCLDSLADVINTVGNALAVAQPGARRSYMRQARNQLHSVAAQLHPDTMGIETMEGQGLVLLLRPMVVDLLEATGASHEEALSHLPRLDDWDRL
ncbi:FUSC family protein [Kocuria soli]|uniref:FUSC family protein n=1 Tax=Kocuria soli TaxID=2485125 RepID=A0A3N3ZSQ5_9MICC|nr:FUSC family protein [Kocuria soli]ROZ62788.1 FUSC family protein [Kocuria soli]